MASDEDQKLSSDMIFEILTRTSLKTLDTCKCVSKNFNNLVHESSFTPLYCNRTNNMSGYFIQSWPKWTKNKSVFVTMPDHPENDETKGNKIEKMIPEDTRILASCNQGLLCCLREKFRAYRYYVCKPATKQWQPLPNPKLRYETVGVAIMVLGSTPLRFKIIRLSKQRHIVKYNSVICCEIFDSESWAWGSGKQISLHMPYFEFIVDSQPAVRVGKSVYWLTYEDNVISFHEPNESFEKFSLPQAVRELRSNKLVNYKGTLGVSCLREPDNVMELWLKWNDGWALEMAVSISSLECSYPVDLYNADIAFMKTDYKAMFYKLQDGSVRKVDLSFNLLGAKEFFEFRSDWEPVGLRGDR